MDDELLKATELGKAIFDKCCNRLEEFRRDVLLPRYAGIDIALRIDNRFGPFLQLRGPNGHRCFTFDAIDDWASRGYDIRREIIRAIDEDVVRKLGGSINAAFKEAQP